MANVETQLLDDIIVKGRRKLLTLGGAALAGAVLGGATTTAYAASYTDADILNFALNLEYLEANFYFQAAFGCTIDAPNAAAKAAYATGTNGAVLAAVPISGSTFASGGTIVAGGTAVGGTQVPFKTPAIAAYANETAVEEVKHVLFLQKALSTAAVPQPKLNIGTAFQMLGAALTPTAPTFTPYDSENDFLLGAYIFEDVGVTAYHGAASLLTVSGNLSAAAGILAVEAYHAGLVRTTITGIDAANGNTALSGVTTAISNLRASLSKAGRLGVAAGTYDPDPDDYGTTTNFSVSLAGATSVTATRIIDADPTNSIAFSRNTTQVLNIVTGGGAVNTAGTAAVSPAVGIFFTNGMNAGPNGFR
jgi:hypothetical protein